MTTLQAESLHALHPPEEFPALVSDALLLGRRIRAEKARIAENEVKLAEANGILFSMGHTVTNVPTDLGDLQTLWVPMAHMHDARVSLSTLEPDHTARRKEIAGNLDKYWNRVLVVRALGGATNFQRAVWDGSDYANRKPDDDLTSEAVGRFYRSTDVEYGSVLLLKGTREEDQGVIYTVPLTDRQTLLPAVEMTEVPRKDT